MGQLFLEALKDMSSQARKVYLESGDFGEFLHLLDAYMPKSRTGNTERAGAVAQTSTTAPADGEESKFDPFFDACFSHSEELPDRGDVKRADVWKIYFHFRDWDTPLMVATTFRFLTSTMQREVKRRKTGDKNIEQGKAGHGGGSAAALKFNLKDTDKLSKENAKTLSAAADE